jgi:hypothetical protein
VDLRPGSSTLSCKEAALRNLSFFLSCSALSVSQSRRKSHVAAIAAAASQVRFLRVCQHAERGGRERGSLHSKEVVSFFLFLHRACLDSRVMDRGSLRRRISSHFSIPRQMHIEEIVSRDMDMEVFVLLRRPVFFFLFFLFFWGVSFVCFFGALTIRVLVFLRMQRLRM